MQEGNSVLEQARKTPAAGPRPASAASAAERESVPSGPASTRSLKVVYDGHMFRWPSIGGITRYFTEVISRLPEDWTPAIVGAVRHPWQFPKHPRLEVSPLSSLRPRRFSQPLKKEWWKRRFLDKADVFHPTYYQVTGGLDYADVKCPVVITVHDFIKARYPHLEDDGEISAVQQKAAILRATHLICISKATEADTLERFPQVAGRTSVIYHGSSFPIATEPQSDRIFDPPVFLFVGRRATYKNFVFLLRAFAKACQAHPRIRLRLAGPPLNQEERWLVHLSGVADRIDLTPRPDEAALQRLYRESVALVYPSFHEGFGMPALEAMACGTLPITANTTSMPEVVGDGGITLDPQDEDAWVECLLQVANGNVPRAQLLKNAKRRATELSWENCAARHAAVYRMLADGK